MEGMIRGSNDLGFDLFGEPVSHFEAGDEVLRCNRRCGVAGAEREPPALLGWYYYLRMIYMLRNIPPPFPPNITKIQYPGNKGLNT